jgi:hypothetical protein
MIMILALGWGSGRFRYMMVGSWSVPDLLFQGGQSR